MKKFFTLLKVSIQSMLLSSTNSRGRSRKRRPPAWALSLSLPAWASTSPVFTATC